MKKCAIIVAGLLSGLAVSCASPKVAELPAHCITEKEWGIQGDIFIERMEYCGSANWSQAGRCEREDYLETYCYGINAYRKSLGADE